MKQINRFSHRSLGGGLARPRPWVQGSLCVVLCASLVACDSTSNKSTAVSMTPAAPNELRDPPVWSSANGVLDLLVVAKAAAITQFVPYRPTGWVYEICPRPTDGSNACPVNTADENLYGGTRLQLSPGDLLKIRLVNHLPPITGAAFTRGAGEEFLALNPTNLHMHGMLVSPRYATAGDATWGDNVFVYNFNSANGIPSLDSNLHGTALFDVVDYSIPVPLSHPSGIFWFHPHVHGISENQVAAGMSGIITVGEIYDYACGDSECGPGAIPTTTRHLILKDTEVLRDGTLLTQVDSNFCFAPPGPPMEPPSVPAAAIVQNQGGCAGANPPYYTGLDYTGGRWFFTINGQQYPNITVVAPAGQLWRIVNASASATYHLNLWDSVAQRQMLMRVVSIDGVSIDVGAGTDVSELIAQTGNRFVPVPCPGSSGAPDNEICTTNLDLMPSSRAEVWVTYRDASGAPNLPPPGSGAVLRTSGWWAGPEGNTWPAIDLASVQFAQTQTPYRALAVTGQVSRLADPRGIAEELRASNADVPTDPTCGPLPPTHKRRIFFGTSANSPYAFGLGYEEIDGQGVPVPGTFIDVAPFNPAAPTVCVPLGPGNAPVTEQWELVNIMGSDHNFHIHQAHFSVLSESAVAGTAVPGQIAGKSIMMDSLPLIHADGNCHTVADWRSGACTAHPATVEIAFSIAGDFVYHCHILQHEDAGMMAVIRVRSAPGVGSSLVDRVLSAMRMSGGEPRQPVTPRLGGVICRTPSAGAAASEPGARASPVPQVSANLR